MADVVVESVTADFNASQLFDFETIRIPIVNMINSFLNASEESIEIGLIFGMFAFGVVWLWKSL